MKFNWFRKRPKSNTASQASRRRQQHSKDSQPDFVLINTMNPFNGVDPLADVRVKIIADDTQNESGTTDSDSTGE